MRKKARLSLIFVSDEKDTSNSHTHYYVNYFRSLKEKYKLEGVIASLIGGLGTSSKDCIPTNQLRSQSRYQEVVKYFSGELGVFCYKDWTTMLANIGKKALALQDTFFLSRPADSTTIVVKVKGQTIAKSKTNGWNYDSNQHAIVFSGSSIPASGDSITIDYKSLCLP